MKVFSTITSANYGRFKWIRDENLTDVERGVSGAAAFLGVYRTTNAGIFDSMQAAFDTNTPYAQDLLLRFTTAILEGEIK